VKAVVLASGRGSNFEAILSAIKDQRILNLTIELLLTDRPDTGAAILAGQHGIAVRELDFASFSSPRDFHDALKSELESLAPDLVLALGFMRVLKKDLIALFPQRIINIHPSLLPAFPGMKAQKQAIDYGVRVSGCTVHFIDSGVDTGPIILQQALSIESGWTEADLSQKLLLIEHRLLVEAVSLFAQSRLRVNGRHVEILNP
jgi:phosphoribosylglycinamide formyltransferase-1